MTKERRERERNKQNAESTRYTSPTALFQITRMIAQVKKREGTFTFLLCTPSFVSHYFWYFFFFFPPSWCGVTRISLKEQWSPLLIKDSMWWNAWWRRQRIQCYQGVQNHSIIILFHPNNPCQLFCYSAFSKKEKNLDLAIRNDSQRKVTQACWIQFATLGWLDVDDIIYLDKWMSGYDWLTEMKLIFFFYILFI